MKVKGISKRMQGYIVYQKLGSRLRSFDEAVAAINLTDSRKTLRMNRREQAFAILSCRHPIRSHLAQHLAAA